MQINLLAFKELLTNAFPDVQVFTALSGKEGIKTALTENPDVILIDLVMPDMDGIETCKKIKEYDSLLLVPVIMITASSPDSIIRARALRSGAISFLTKPIDSIELIAQFSSVIKFRNDEKKFILENRRMRDFEKLRADDLEKELKRAYYALEQSPVSIIITDVEGNIVYCNPKVSRLTGYPVEKLHGRNPRIFQSGETAKSVYRKMWKTILNGKEWRGEFQNKKKSGELYWESVLISPIFHPEGRIINFLAVKEDVTEWKRMMQDMKMTQDQALESDRLKSAFLMNISHEIRTPMNAILGFTSLLKDSDLRNQDQREFVRIIESSGHRLLNTINELIEMAKIESEQTRMLMSAINLNEEIESIYNFFKAEVEQKGITFTYKTGLPDNKAVIRSDSEKLNFILVHLVSNAIKYSNKGQIEFGYVKKGKNLEFFVKDNGVGIRDDQKRIIFERFRQSNESLTRDFQGIGLGLTISKAFVGMLKGKIWVESEDSQGSTFYFTIPYNNRWKDDLLVNVEGVNIDQKKVNI
jgi:PAS domain S-box-containing protein